MKTNLIKFGGSKILHLIKSRNYCSGNSNFATVSTIIGNWERKFKINNISEPDLSIRHIMVHVLNLSSIDELSSLRSQTLNSSQTTQLINCCHCRLSRMPIQYIIGNWQFMDLNVRLIPPVFIPRPETEEFVDIIINKMKSSNLNSKILEIGCGSGVISLALLKSLSQIHCTAIDQSKFACELTLENAKINNIDMTRLQVYRANITACGISGTNFEKKFDVIISNPPYIDEELLPTLSPEIVLYEDLHALNGGDDGLEIIRYIIDTAPNLLQPNGRIFLETDPKHPEMIHQHLKQTQSKLRLVQTYRDFTKQNRFIELFNS